LAEHLEVFSHDTINRYLRGEKLTPRLLWDNVKPLLQLDADGSVVFDDTVIDKNSSRCIELVRRQYSGNEHRVIRGIGLISCVYVNGKTGQFWVVDYRIYDPDGDGKTKLDHVADRLQNLVFHKQLPFARVLMDSWYAAQNLMAVIDQLGKHREVKQLTGIEACQCRKARIQRNHIACAVLVWNCLKKTSYQSSQSVYQLKQGWLSGYLIEQLKCPSVPMQLV
jgi:hypothetical protein